MSENPTIKLNDQVTLAVLDPDNVRPVFADIVTEIRIVDGVVHLSLASTLCDGDAPGVRSARICARLRLAPATAVFIHNALAAQGKISSPSGQKLN